LKSVSVVLIIFINIALLFTPARADSPSPHSPEEFVVTNRLWENEQWHALLHCKEATGEECNSAAAQGIFVNPNQQDSAKEELLHAIRALLNPETTHSYQCSFPARTTWIRKALGALERGIPSTSCPDFEDWYKAIAPYSVTVIFPSSFLNNPASAFGHTLLRFDRKDAQSKDKLTSYTGNFSASTSDDAALLYVLKGVFGGYYGFFSVAPYYDKVKLYSDLEDRDIWEYDLTLTPEEVSMMVKHLWELRAIPFGYYYFDDNCSYQLLSLIEVGRPSLRLMSRLPAWVIPVDTLRLIYTSEGLVKNSLFRPSLASALKYRTEQATAEQIDWAKGIVSGKLSIERDLSSGLSLPEKAGRLELAYDMATYATVRHSIDEDRRESLAWTLLSERSKVKVGTPFTEHPTPEFQPHNAHPTVKISAGVGMADDISYGRFTIRPAFHDQADDPRGYLPGAQIKFVDTMVRMQGEEGFLLERLDLLSVESLAPRQAFYAPISWSVHLSANHGAYNNVQAPFVYSLSGGPGFSFSLPSSGLAYSLLEIDAQGSKNLDVGWSVGGGPKAGLQFSLLENWRIGGEVQATRYFAGDLGTTIGAKIFNDLPLSNRLSLRLSASHGSTRQNEETIYLSELVYYGSPTL
jgi:hypothetical protein